MKVADSIKEWLKRFDTSEKKSKENAAATEDSPTDSKNSFLSFLHQQAELIVEHQKYEKDITHSVASHSDVLVEFKVEDYVNNIDLYFEKKGFYNRKAEDLFPIIINILVPPEDIRTMLSKDLYLRLFAGILIRIGLHTNLSLADIIKTYYDEISKTNGEINGVEKEAVLELYKESIERTNKLREAKVRESSELKEDSFSMYKVLDGILNSFSIKSGRDLRKLYAKTSLIDGALGVFLNAVLIVLFLYFHNEIHVFITSVVGDPNEYVYNLIIFGILVGFLVYGFAQNLYRQRRRKALKKTLKTVVEYFNITHAYLKRYFQNQYGFDVKKIR